MADHESAAGVKRPHPDVEDPMENTKKAPRRHEDHWNLTDEELDFRRNPEYIHRLSDEYIAGARYPDVRNRLELWKYLHGPNSGNPKKLLLVGQVRNYPMTKHHDEWLKLMTRHPQYSEFFLECF